MRWLRIRFDEHGQPCWIVLPAERTKTHEARVIPISQRLRAVLDVRRTGSNGSPLPAAAYVFGNEVGESIGSISTAWRACCRRAGVEELHFHDLRREFACRLMESGARDHDVRDFLGHANITTTSRYLRSAPVRLAAALKQMEANSPQFCTRFAHAFRSGRRSAASEISPNGTELNRLKVGAEGQN